MKLKEIVSLQRQINGWAKELGFQQIGFTDTDLSTYTPDYRAWLAKRFYGDMNYMARNVAKRENPSDLLPGTVCIISARMDYLTEDNPRLNDDPNAANISRYALGRDYHKTVRKRLNQLAKRIERHVDHQFRAFVDSAPVLEKPIAAKAGLGWIGKHTLVLNEEAGSFFFLGEIFTDIPFKSSRDIKEDRCGACRACINVCPTKAIIGPHHLDARRCISYLTIEHKGSIPLEFRKAIGNRIFGCDDCQLICPWNRFARTSIETDFMPRHDLDNATLIDLLGWDEATFLTRTEGMALRRVNFSQWVRNLAVAAGNAEPSVDLKNTLRDQRTKAHERGDEMCLEHLEWALNQLELKDSTSKSARDIA
ncbi:MAG: tRNA epoxyqueuosine(34) reductase QueG [Gammaproteobacteria bacterium]|nr:tRNA epoxyqueuosine(34) reductase QueG [Gammaproteobacteria bacterium]